MKRGVLVGSLVVLAAAGWTSALRAQESAVWRSARPVSADSLRELRPCPTRATLGRPEPLDESEPAPAGESGGVVPVGYRRPAGAPIATTGHAGAARMSDDLVAEWPDEESAVADAGTEFAIDRPATAGERVAQMRLASLTATAALASGQGAPAPFPAVPASTVWTRAGVAGPSPSAVGTASCAAGGPCIAFGDDGPAQPRLYLRGEYLLWYTKRDQVPVLASTSATQDNGILGNPTTQVLFGGDGLNRDPRSGFRLFAGYWFDDECKETALEFGGFYLGQRSTKFDVGSDTTPLIARPFFNLNSGTEFSEITAFPGLLTGRLTIAAPSQLWGLESNLRCNLCCGCNYRVDLLGGFRYLDLQESITMVEQIQALPAAAAPFTNQRITVSDRFATHDQFYGAQLGLSGEWRRGPWSVEPWGKVALGDTHQSITIEGSQRFVAPNGTAQNFVGGLLALNSNIGHFSRDKFSVVPEVGLNVGYQFNEHVKAYVGYSFLYWSNVARPGGQIDRVIDITRIPNFPVPGTVPTGQNRPAPLLNSTDFWAQGINVGLEFRY